MALLVPRARCFSSSRLHKLAVDARFLFDPANAILFLLVCCMLVVRVADGCNGRYNNYCDTAEEADQEELMRSTFPHLFEHPTPPIVEEEEDPFYDEGPPLIRRLRRGINKPSYLRSGEGQMSKQISSVLNQLFNNGYDEQIRPQLGSGPLVVTVNINIRSMGPVNEQKQTFSLDCYFRQYWRDERLRYNATRLKELPMNWQFLYKIWRPDTYIINGQKSYLHKMTVPNRFIRISPDGTIYYSQRLTVKARCEMDLHKFPLDDQECPLEIGSFGHASDDIQYHWQANNPISQEDVGLAQYVLVNHTHSEFMGVKMGRNVSTVLVNFKFKRQQGFYLLQIYIPLTLIVMCSWVTFWLSKTERGAEIPARTSLGASSVLSVVTIGFGGKSKPNVDYATALDIFIILCFVNVFAALIEFALLNFLDTLVRRVKRKEQENKLIMLMAQHHVMGARMPIIPKRQESMMDTDGILGDEALITPPASSTPTPADPEPTRGNVFNFNGLAEEEEDLGCCTRCLDCIINFLQFFNCCRNIRTMEIYRKPMVVFNRVDRYCRRLFPLAFLAANIFYMYWYEYTIWG